MKNWRVIQTKFHQLSEENVHMINNLADKACFSDIRVINISKSFTHKMAAEASWHRYGMKLRHWHPMYSTLQQTTRHR